MARWCSCPSTIFARVLHSLSHNGPCDVPLQVSSSKDERLETLRGRGRRRSVPLRSGAAALIGGVEWEKFPPAMLGSTTWLKASGEKARYRWVATPAKVTLPVRDVPLAEARTTLSGATRQVD